MSRLVLCALLGLLLAASARADPIPEQSSAELAATRERSTYLQASLGYLLPVPRENRDDQGVDLGAAYGFRRRIWRVGGEARFAPYGGFDSTEARYRFDIGVAPAVELFTSRYVSLQLGLRGLFSRAGTYRRSDVAVTHQNPEGPVVETVSFVAWYGFTASFDLALFFPYCFVRASGMHTSWYWSREREPPMMEHWAHFAVGYAY